MHSLRAAIAILPTLLVLLTGCQSGYSRFFTSAVTEPHPPIAEYAKYNLVAYAGEPVVQYELFNEELGRRLLEDGFVPLGESSFSGPMEDEGALIAQAKRIGAELVIASSQYERTAAGAIPLTTYTPQTFNSSGTVYTNSGWATYSGTSWGTVSQTTMMPYSVDRYYHGASYWTRNARPRIFGGYVDELSIEDRRQVGANDGVRLIAAQRDSAAWKANLLPGDILLAIDGQPVKSTRDWAEKIEQSAGKAVAITVSRGSERRDIVVRLNPKPSPEK